MIDRSDKFRALADFIKTASKVGKVLDTESDKLLIEALEIAASRSYSVSETVRRKERISMAKEICSHRGENVNSVDRNGHEGWEKYEPLAGACIREAERLFALRSPAQPASPSGSPVGWYLSEENEA